MSDLKRKLAIGGVILGFSIPLYLIPNHFPLIEPTLLPLTVLDQSIPFIPDSIWIYHSEYLLLIMAYLLSDSEEALYRFWKSLISVLLISAIIFTLFPTTYPRELFPLPVTMNSISRFLFKMQRNADTPLNCFPSLHVGAVFSAVFLIQHQKIMLKIYFCIWAVLISISTLTTKQHYVWDVAAGLTLAYGCHRYYGRKINPQ